MAVEKIETDIIACLKASVIGQAVILVKSRSSRLTIVFNNKDNRFDVTLTDNFQYQN